MNDKIEKDVYKVQPLKKICMTIGELPTSYLETMTYYEMLIWFTNFLRDNIIPTVNNNAEAVKELQNLFTELQNYVNNYFDNLDVQDEINNKLDKMLENGTLQTLIDNYAQPILSDLTSEINNTKDQVDQAVNDVNQLISEVETPIQKLRKEYYNNYSNFNFPVTMNSYFNILQLYRSNDKQNFKHNITKDMLPFTTSETVYVDNINGNNTNAGTTEQTAFKTIDYAISSASSDRTVILLNDIYYRSDMPNSARIINYNFNFISKNGHSIMGLYDKLTYTVNDTYDNVYQATRSNANTCIDIRANKYGAYSELTKVNTLELCSTTLNSWYTDGTYVYANIGEEVTNDKILFGLGVGASPWSIVNSSKALNIYFENIDFIANNYPIFKLQCSTYQHELRMYGCKLLFSKNVDYDGLSNQGCKTLLMKCIADRNEKDGFNYHAYNSKIAVGIEIDCIASNNGLNQSSNNNNGSTAHDGCQVIRINGNYFNNKGGNVADVHDNTLSININCNAYDTKASQGGGYNSDFVTQQAGATMYLYNCLCAGSSSDTNLYAVNDSYIYYSNCEFDTSHGDGVIEIEN